MTPERTWPVQYQYGAIHLQLVEGRYEHRSHQGLGAPDMDGLGWSTRLSKYGDLVHFVHDPAVVLNHVGSRGWEPFDVSPLGDIWVFHLRRATGVRTPPPRPPG